MFWIQNLFSHFSWKCDNYFPLSRQFVVPFQRNSRRCLAFHKKVFIQIHSLTPLQTFNNIFFVWKEKVFFEMNTLQIKSSPVLIEFMRIPLRWYMNGNITMIFSWDIKEILVTVWILFIFTQQFYVEWAGNCLC